MNTELLNFLKQFVDLPAVFLAICVGLMLYVVYKAQQQTSFNFANMLRDENGKESSHRLVVIGCFGISSWLISADFLTNKEINENAMFIYVGIFSLSKTAEAIIVSRSTHKKVATNPEE